jgi:hypothetical protein
MPGKIYETLTIAFFSLFSGKLKNKLIDEQYEFNKSAWEKLNGNGSFVEYQPNLTTMRYGHAGPIGRKLFFHGKHLTAANNTCEVISVYNALHAFGKDRSLPDLIKEFSKKGICANGCFGTSPKALKRFFDREGYKTELLVGKDLSDEALSAWEKEYDVFLLTSFNRGYNPFHMVHTMCISHEKDGFIRHNDYRPRTPLKSLKEGVYGYNEGESRPICLLAVKPAP